MYTDDPIRDAEAHDRKQEAWLVRRPICCECDRHIQEDTLFNINGKVYCISCLEAEFMEYIEEE